MQTEQIKRFLEKVDRTFPVPLSKKQDLAQFAQKLQEKATLCAVENGGEVLSMTAGYTENLVNGLAYISIVATVPEAQGNGYGERTVRAFLAACAQKHLRGVHLYAVAGNEPALSLYRKLGFEIWEMPDEPRPDDVHLIYYIQN